MINKSLQTMIAVTAVATVLSMPLISSDGAAANAAEVKVLCANGMREVLSELQPQLERTTGQRVTISFGQAGDLRKRIQDGEIADVIVMPKDVLDQLLTQGKIGPDTAVDLAQDSIGIGVRTDAPKPDISSVDGFKRTVLAAKSIAIVDPASGGMSGVHIAEVFQRLGIAEQVKPKLKLNRLGSNSALVVRGDAEMAIQTSSAILAVPGIEFIPLPAEIQRTIVFSAALASNAKEPDLAKALLQFLQGPTSMTAIRAKGMAPVPTK